MILVLKTAPAVEPIDLEEAKLQIRVDGAAENSLILHKIVAAREAVEAFCGPLITQTWEQYEDEWPGGEVLSLGLPRVQSVTSIKYMDQDGTEYTFSADNYTVNTQNEYRPGVVLKPNCSWPSEALFNSNPITITLVCGYGDAPAAVPRQLWQAMMFLIGHWQEERQLTVVGKHAASVPMTFKALIANYRIY